MTSNAKAAALEIVRVLPATPDEVFRAWTDPELLASWMSPVGHAEAETDVRPGGSFRITMVGEGRRIEHTGEYIELDPPRGLTFTWRSPYTAGEASVVRVQLRPAPEGTELVLRHENLPPEAVASHEGGWGSMLDRLAEMSGR